MKPSRTFTLSAVALGLLGLELVCVVLIAWLAPGGLEAAGPTLTTLALSIAGAGGIGSGSMALRDFGSGGRTSSQSAQVSAGRVAEAKARHGSGSQ